MIPLLALVVGPRLGVHGDPAARHVIAGSAALAAASAIPASRPCRPSRKTFAVRGGRSHPLGRRNRAAATRIPLPDRLRRGRRSTPRWQGGRLSRRQRHPRPGPGGHVCRSRGQQDLDDGRLSAAVRFCLPSPSEQLAVAPRERPDRRNRTMTGRLQTRRAGGGWSGRMRAPTRNRVSAASPSWTADRPVRGRLMDQQLFPWPGGASAGRAGGRCRRTDACSTCSPLGAAW